MPLQPGSRIDRFEILSLLGKGGMGEVYRARDGRLGRDVAIKILPEDLAQDEERLARFEREAKSLATLKHPNIATIYDFGSTVILPHKGASGDGDPSIADQGPDMNRPSEDETMFDREGGNSVWQRSAGTARAHYIVMELHEGETLAARMRRYRIPLQELVPIFIQIAEGLEAAHEYGIVHRDLKPANVQIADQGTVKLIDFGLAKIARKASLEASLETVASTEEESITLESEIGAILGTPSYMSPEQIRGEAVDKRTDIWSFGCCMYEALSGKRPFTGSNAGELMRAVLEAAPDWSALPRETPWRIRELLEDCVQEDRARRLRDIGDARATLLRVTADDDQTRGTRQRPRLWAAGAALAIVSILILVAVVATSIRSNSPLSPASRPTAQFVIAQPANERPAMMLFPRFTPDGKAVLYEHRGDTMHVHLRNLTGTDRDTLTFGKSGGAITPIVSPDGAWLGYLDPRSDELKRTPIDGGPAITVAKLDTQVTPFWGFEWLHQDSIVLSNLGGGLQQLSVTSGTMVPLTILDSERGEQAHVTPRAVPGGDWLLFVAFVGRDSSTTVEILSLKSGIRHTLIEQARNPRYVSSGHIAFFRDNAIWTAPFDESRGRIVGDAVPVILDVHEAGDGVSAQASYDVSVFGDLVYVKRDDNFMTRLVWRDRSGRVIRREDQDQAIHHPQVSPDSTRYAAVSGTGLEREIWVFDTDGRPPIKVLDADQVYSPLWSPDGEWILFERSTPGDSTIWYVAADGSSDEARRVLKAGGHRHPLTWVPDTWELIFVDMSAADDLDLMKVKVDLLAEAGNVQENPAVDFVKERYWTAEGGAKIAPDGHWLAYTSRRTGNREVWIAEIGNPGSARQVSVGGGSEPVWSGDGGELFFLQGDSLMSIETPQDEFATIGDPDLLFSGGFLVAPQPPSYDVDAEGRFVMVESVDEAGAPFLPLVVVQGWVDELKRPGATPQ